MPNHMAEPEGTGTSPARTEQTGNKGLLFKPPVQAVSRQHLRVCSLSKLFYFDLVLHHSNKAEI